MKATLSTSLAPSIGGGLARCTRIGGCSFGSAFFITPVFGVSTTFSTGKGSPEDAELDVGVYCFHPLPVSEAEERYWPGGEYSFHPLPAAAEVDK